VGHRGTNIADQTSGSREGIHEGRQEVNGNLLVFFVVVVATDCTEVLPMMCWELLVGPDSWAGLVGAFGFVLIFIEKRGFLWNSKIPLIFINVTNLSTHYYHNSVCSRYDRARVSRVGRFVLSPQSRPLSAKFAAQHRELCARRDTEPAHTIRPGIRSSYQPGRVSQVIAGS
jgi:hypothetical protein